VDASWTQADREFMSRALELAALGRYSVRPNPMVGCVLVKDGRIVGEGSHARAGQPHAEVHAMRQAGAAAQGATAYVTLEPCAHHGRTPPCAQALLGAGVGRVVAAHVDPDPRVAGKGLALLQAAGVAVACGLLEAEARRLNRGFLSRIERGRPWLRLKLALSLDGAMALADGRSQWITGVAAREDAQQWRARAGVILAGIASVMSDDPRLTVRYSNDPMPAATVPLIVDSHARLPASARLLQLHPAIWWAHGDMAAAEDAVRSRCQAHPALHPLPCRLDASGRIDLTALLGEIGQRGINEVHAEAGPTLAASLLAADLVDELLIYQAGKLLGPGAQTPFRVPIAATVPERSWWLEHAKDVGGDLRSSWIRARST
jgi:diaminohydroxyphosphoribosylaminopyrimidine deaminase/5-amino-6-(5-phosphoribosylamino)uracil reductase